MQRVSRFQLILKRKKNKKKFQKPIDKFKKVCYNVVTENKERGKKNERVHRLPF